MDLALRDGIAGLAILVSLGSLGVAVFTYWRVGRFAEAQFAIEAEHTSREVGSQSTFLLMNLGPNAASEVSFTCAFDPLRFRTSFPDGRTLAKDEALRLTVSMHQVEWDDFVVNHPDERRRIATVRWKSRTGQWKAEELTLPPAFEGAVVIGRKGDVQPSGEPSPWPPAVRDLGSP